MKHVVCMLFCFALATPALATAPYVDLGMGNAVAASAQQKQQRHEKLTAQEADFIKDKAEYEALMSQSLLCVEGDAPTGLMDCSELSEAQLKGSYPTTAYGKNARTRLSKEQEGGQTKRIIELQQKWAGKP
ncbi:MAG: hypothetical protein V4735_00675 [Pseudomonadota bacterium]